MTARTAISWRNWCAEVGSVTGSYNFASTPPVSNLLTPRTGELAFSSNIASDYAEVTIEWTGGRPVDLVAILNHNMYDEFTVPAVFLTDEAGNELQIDLLAGATGSSLEVQRHMYFIAPGPSDEYDFNSQNVKRVVVSFPQRAGDVRYGSIDEWTGAYTPDQLQVGGIWAGPLWIPTNGFKQTGWGQGVTEQKRLAVSIGGQLYASAEPRRRRMPWELPQLDDDEVYRLDITPYSAQRIFNWLGTSRPLIAIPDLDDAEATFMQAVYGYLDQDPSWVKTESGFRISGVITEAL